MNTAEQAIIELMKRGEISNDDGLKTLFELQHKEQAILPPENEDQQDLKTVKVHATGDTYHHDPKNPAMLPVPQQILLSRFTVAQRDPKTGKKEVRSYMSERELKLLFFLLHAVWDELEPGVEHEIRVLDAWHAMKHEYGGTTNTTTWIWESAKILATTIVEWTENLGDRRFKGVGALLSYALTDSESKDTGVLKFKFCEKLVPLLKEPSRFTKLKLHFLMNLSSRHAIILYGILEGYANYDYKNVFTFELDLIRSWLKIEPEQYRLYADIRRFVLEPAFKQINKNPEGAGFSVSYKPIKRGRKVHAIEITINKIASRLQLEDKLKNKKQKPSSTTAPPCPRLNMEHVKNIVAKGMRTELGISRGDPNAEIGRLKELWWESAIQSGDSEIMQCPEAHLGEFVLTKLAQEKGIKRDKKRRQTLQAVNSFRLTPV